MLIFTGQQAHSAATEWKFDTIHSNFYFDIDHTYATVRGFFEDYSGTFRFDPNNLKESKIIFKINTKSINTNERKRDNHLRNEEFFDVKKYPLPSEKEGQKSGIKRFLIVSDDAEEPLNHEFKVNVLFTDGSIKEYDLGIFGETGFLVGDKAKEPEKDLNGDYLWPDFRVLTDKCK